MGEFRYPLVDEKQPLTPEYRLVKPLLNLERERPLQAGLFRHRPAPEEGPEADDQQKHSQHQDPTCNKPLHSSRM